MIRRLREDDISRVMDRWMKRSMWQSGSIPECYWQGRFYEINKQIAQTEVYIYEQEGHIGGFIGLQQGYITGLFVVLEARCLGIGRVLLEKAKSLYDTLVLTVYVENSNAVRFYLHQGFRIHRTRKEQETGKREFLMVWQAACDAPLESSEMEQTCANVG